LENIAFELVERLGEKPETFANGADGNGLLATRQWGMTEEKRSEMEKGLT